MTDTNHKSKKLNPEIKQKAIELFDLIEQECEQGHCDYTFENMVEEMGDLLQQHHGFDELIWAYRGSRPKSKEAVWSLEDILKRLNDDELDNLRRYSTNSVNLAKYLNGEGEISDSRLIESILKHGKNLDGCIGNEYYERIQRYRSEIEELKEAS